MSKTFEAWKNPVTNNQNGNITYCPKENVDFFRKSDDIHEDATLIFSYEAASYFDAQMAFRKFLWNTEYVPPEGWEDELYE